MSGVALTADQVGVVVSYLAPGYLARFGYCARFAGPERTTGEVVVISAALSLPLVALVGVLVPGSHAPTRLAYVLPLVAISLLLGYLAAVLRSTRFARAWLEDVLDYRATPWHSTYAELFDQLPTGARVTVTLGDGRRVTGTPRLVPHAVDSPMEEIFLADVRIEQTGSAERTVAGLLVPLREVASIELPADPYATRG